MENGLWFPLQFVMLMQVAGAEGNDFWVLASPKVVSPQEGSQGSARALAY